MVRVEAVTLTEKTGAMAIMPIGEILDHLGQNVAGLRLDRRRRQGDDDHVGQGPGAREGRPVRLELRQGLVHEVRPESASGLPALQAWRFASIQAAWRAGALVVRLRATASLQQLPPALLVCVRPKGSCRTMKSVFAGLTIGTCVGAFVFLAVVTFSADGRLAVAPNEWLAIAAMLTIPPFAAIGAVVGAAGAILRELQAARREQDNLRSIVLGRIARSDAEEPDDDEGDAA